MQRHATHLAGGGFRTRLPANPPDQTEQLLPDAIALHLPALNESHALSLKRTKLFLLQRHSKSLVADLLDEHEKVGELIEAELDRGGGDDCVNVFDHS